MSSAWSFSYVLFRFSTYCIITSVAFDMRFSCREEECEDTGHLDEKLISTGCSEPSSGLGDSKGYKDQSDVTLPSKSLLSGM